MLSKRFLMLPVLSSAARMPLPRATIALATRISSFAFIVRSSRLTGSPRGAPRADAHRAPRRVQAPQAAAAGGARDLDPGASRRIPAGAGGGPDQRRLDTGCPRGADGAHRLLRRTRQLRDRGELPCESRVAAAEPGHPPRAL